MTASNLPEIGKSLNMKAIKIFATLFLLILIIGSTNAQPVWNSAPTVATFPLRLELSFNADRASNVYFFVLPGNYAGGVSNADVKFYSLLTLPTWIIVQNGMISYTGGLINTTYTQIINGLYPPIQANSTYTVYVVAEEISTGILTAVSRTVVTTPPCPAIDIAFGYTQPEECVNKGTTLQLNFFPGDPNPDLSGIYVGTKYFIDWGDGNTVTWLSTALLQVPPLATRRHTFAPTVNCNQEVIIVVTSSCSPLIVKQFKTAAIIHGRDITGEGDGGLLVVDNSTWLSTTIQVCEGNSHTITLKDMSTWNCLAPTFIDGSPAPANTDPRTIQWVYGQDNGGTLQNTIGQALGVFNPVVIGGVNNTVRTINGYIQPVISPPLYKGELSQTIFIPATCRVGEYYDVYLRNWSKCNPYLGGLGDPPVFTQIRSLVVASPPAPTAPNRTICFGDVRTLTVTSPPVGTISWYSDALLTTLLGTGISYTPVQTAVGSYNFWVVDKSLTGLLCQSLSTQVTLTINPLPNKPTVTFTGSLSFCFDGGVTSVTLTANPNTPPAITSYQWYKNGTAVGGAVTNAITLNDPSQNGIYTVRTFGVNPTNCPGPLSDPLTVTIYSLTNLTQPTDKTVCELGSTTFSASTTDPIQKWQWEISTDGGLTWGNANNGTYYNGFNTNVLSVVNAPLSFNGYRYRVQITTTAGGCTYPSNSALLTVNQLATATAPSNAAVCQGAAASFAITAGGGASTIQWQPSNNGGTTRTNITGAAIPNDGCTYSNFNTATLGIAGTQNGMNNYQYHAVLTTTSGSCVTTSAAGVLTVTQLATTTAPSNAAVCQGAAASFAITAGGGASTIQWQRSNNGGTTWTNITGAAIPNDGCTYSNFNTATLGIAGTQNSMNNYQYHAVLTTTSGSCVTTSASAVLTVNTLLPVSVLIAASANPVCSGTSVTFTASPTNGGTTPAYQWYKGATPVATNSTTYTYTPVNGDVISVVLTSNASPCATGNPATSNTITMTVNPILPVSVTIGAANPVCAGTSVTFTATPVNGGTTPLYQWYKGATAVGTNSATYTYTPVNGDMITVVMTSPACPVGGPVTSNPITMTVNANPTATIAPAVPATCAGVGLVLTATPAGGSGTYTTHLWTGAGAASLSSTSVANPTFTNATA